MRVRTLLLLAAAGGLAYWIARGQPSIAGMVENLTRPLMGSKAAVKESEHNRVVSDSAPVAESEEGEGVPLTMLREKMTYEEVKGVLGPPDSVEKLVEEGKPRTRWTYRRPPRSLLFENGRVISIAIR